MKLFRVVIYYERENSFKEFEQRAHNMPEILADLSKSLNLFENRCTMIRIMEKLEK